MMNDAQLDINVWSLKIVYKAALELYDDYFKKLELVLKYSSKVERPLIERRIQEAEEAMKKDLAIFAKATQMGVENLEKLTDTLHIQSLYPKSLRK